MKFICLSNLNYQNQTIAEIFQAGYSRIPVYEKDKNDIIGLILTKDLIFIDPEVFSIICR
jgi:CBS domain containing-hemolysin-like protein